MVRRLAGGKVSANSVPVPALDPTIFPVVQVLNEAEMPQVKGNVLVDLGGWNDGSAQGVYDARLVVDVGVAAGEVADHDL